MFTYCDQKRNINLYCQGSHRNFPNSSLIFFISLGVLMRSERTTQTDKLSSSSEGLDSQSSFPIRWEDVHCKLGIWRHFNTEDKEILKSQNSVTSCDWTACCRCQLPIDYYYYYLLKAHSPVNHTGSSQGFSLVQILHKLDYLEYNTKHAHYTNIKHINIIRKVVPSVLLS